MTSQQESQPSPPTVKWWLAVDGETKGPYNQAYAVAMLKSAKIDGTTLACPEGGQQWKPLSDWPAFADAVGQTASPPTTAGAAESQVSSATPATPAAVYAEPAKGDDDSRLLTNPQLPSMANWICIYSIAISPLLWILANGTCCVSGPTFHEASSLFGIEVILTVVFLPIDLAATILLVIGGLKLRNLRRSSVLFLKIGLWIHVASGALSILISLLLTAVAVASPDDPFAESTPAGEVLSVLLLPVFLGAVVFEIVALVWLYRRGNALPLVHK